MQNAKNANFNQTLYSIKIYLHVYIIELDSREYKYCYSSVFRRLFSSVFRSLLCSILVCVDLASFSRRRKIIGPKLPFPSMTNSLFIYFLQVVPPWLRAVAKDLSCLWLTSLISSAVCNYSNNSLPLLYHNDLFVNYPRTPSFPFSWHLQLALQLALHQFICWRRVFFFNGQKWHPKKTSPHVCLCMGKLETLCAFAPV